MAHAAYEGDVSDFEWDGWEASYSDQVQKFTNYKRLVHTTVGSNDYKEGECSKITIGKTNWYRFGPFRMSFGTSPIETVTINDKKVVATAGDVMFVTKNADSAGNTVQTKYINSNATDEKGNKVKYKYLFSNRAFYVLIKANSIDKICGKNAKTMKIKFKQQDFKYNQGRAYLCYDSSSYNFGQTGMYYTNRASVVEGNEIAFKAPINKEELLDISVKKVWKDSSNADKIRPASIKVRLTSSADMDDTHGTSWTKTISSTSNKYTFKNLNKFDADNNLITYQVEELEVPEGYTVSYSPASLKMSKSKYSYDVSITNTHKTKTPPPPEVDPPSSDLGVLTVKKDGGDMDFRVWEDSKPQWIETKPTKSIYYTGEEPPNCRDDLTVSWSDKYAIDAGTKEGSYTYTYYTTETEQRQRTKYRTETRSEWRTGTGSRPKTDSNGNTVKDKNGNTVYESYTYSYKHYYDVEVPYTDYYTYYTITQHVEKNNCVHKETHDWHGSYSTSKGKCRISGLYPGSYEIYETRSDQGYDLQIQSGYSKSGYHGVSNLRFATTASLSEGSSKTIKLGVSTSTSVKNDLTRGDLEINKVNENGEIVDGVEIAIYGKVDEKDYKYEGWLTGSNEYGEVTWDGISSIFTGTKDSVYVTEGGKISITGLPVGTYSIYETKTKSIEYALEGQGTFDGEKTLLGTVQIVRDMTSELSVTYTQKKRQKGDITINKTGVYGNQGTTVVEKLGNVGFRLKSSATDKGKHKNGEYVQIVENEEGEEIVDFAESEDDATIFETDESGQVIIPGLYQDLGPYTIEEVETDQQDPHYTDIIKMRGDTVIDLTGKSQITANIIDDRSSGELKIIKSDDNYHELKLKGAEFKLKLVSAEYVSASNQWLGGSPDVSGSTYDYKKTKHTEYLVGSSDSAFSFETDENGELSIDKIVNGIYEIYESKAPKGYNLARQDGYNESTQMAYIGTINLTNSNNVITYDITNKKVVSTLDGKVWIDNKTGKLQDEYNNLYDGENSEDKLKEGIKVNLIDDNTNRVMASTQTDKNGYYAFEYYADGSDIIYWDLAHSHIEYIYNNKKVYKDEEADKDKSEHNKQISEYGYIAVEPFVGGFTNVTTNSKAQAKEITDDELDDRNLTGTDEPYPGRAITLIASKVYGYKEILDQQNSLSGMNIYQNQNIDLSDKLLTAYYHDDTFTVNDIDLGLVEKNRTEYILTEDIEYVKMVKGDYTFKYQYGEGAVSDEGYTQRLPDVQLQNTTRTFTQKIYPSDVKYNFANDFNGEDDPNKFVVYVVYKINIKNLTNFQDNEDYYIEKGLHLEQLTSDYDTSRFKIWNQKLAGDDEEIAKDFDKWSQTKDGQVEFNIEASDKKYKKDSEGIQYNEVESTYIQYRVTDEMLAKVTKGDDDPKGTSTIATSYGYHAYTRKDKNWKDNDSHNHRTITEKEFDSGLFLKWHLVNPDRTISGKVFEDDKIDQLDGERNKSREDERIGNGKYDDGTEKNLKNVIVSLIDSVSYNVVDIYNGDLTQTGGKWQTTKTKAIKQVEADGSYSFVGVVPGKYYLQFTYGDGTVTFKDLEGKELTGYSSVQTEINDKGKIRSNYYKSTIVTGDAAAEGDNLNERDWFVNAIGKTNSVAIDYKGALFQEGGTTLVKELDDLIAYRTSSDDELNYNTSKQTLVANAKTPLIDLQFEYKNVAKGEYPSDDHAHAETELTNDCNGMYFGIIERPHVQIELKSTIKNVKLTLSTGTTIINGDPRKQIVSKYLSTLGDNAAKIETETSNLYGSTVTVDYRLKVTNKSEIDYNSKNYYKYGDKTGADFVTTEVTKLIDYESYSECNYVDQTPNLEDVTKKEENYNNTKKEDYYTPDALDKNKGYKQKLLETKNNTEEKLVPEKANSGKSSVDYGITVNKLLSNSMDDLGWQSYTEIIGIKNTTFSPQYDLTSGNYFVGDKAGEEGTTSQADNDSSFMTISTPTGENRSTSVYLIAGAILVVIAGGIVFVKKVIIK